MLLNYANEYMLFTTSRIDYQRFACLLYTSSGSETAGIVSGNIVLPVTEISSTAQFKISPQQFEMLKNGVAKIRLSTIPIEHERTFAKDKIGKKLYQFFLKQKNKDNDF